MFRRIVSRRRGGPAAILLMCTCLSSSLAAAADPLAPGIPVDRNGLPLWVPARYDDRPVRLVLDGPDDLRRLLAEVPLAAFDREQLTPDPAGDGLVFEPRVTAAELEALRGAGWTVTELPDLEQQARREMERAWAASHAKSGAGLWDKSLTYYPTHAQIGQMLGQLAADHPAICRTFTWGTSVQGRELWGLVISADVTGTAAEPEVRLSSSMHGDEPVGMVLLLNLAEDLATNYGVAGHEDVTDLVDNTEIHILPLHNPDGYVAGRRANADFVDLNRNFPEPAGTAVTQAAENVHFMAYGLGQHFVISQNGHGGALVVNYPWDYTYALAPDDAALIRLSLEYAAWNPPMYNSAFFDQGITNGAAWYVATGTLQDWSYAVTGCIDLTVESSAIKTPPPGLLDQYWTENRESLLHFIRAARYGINGLVTDAVTGQPLAATVTVAGNARSVGTDPGHGDYYRLLDTGTYDLTFTAAGYGDSTVSGIVTTWGTPTVLDVALYPDTTSTPEVPAVRLALSARPNPFNPRTELQITIPAAGQADLAIYDLQGRRVRGLLTGWLTPAARPAVWDGRDDAGRAVASGVYVARLRLAGQRTAAKLVLAR